jgi:hypothetical protein
LPYSPAIYLLLLYFAGMRRIIVFGFILLQVFSSCTNNQEQAGSEKPENDVDAARTFIRFALDGDYGRARNLIINDTLNNEYLDNFERYYQNNMSREDKRGYRESSINLYDSRQVSDSITIVNYSNSYKKKRDSLKVVHLNGQWLIDLKYSFPPTDTIKK